MIVYETISTIRATVRETLEASSREAKRVAGINMFAVVRTAGESPRVRETRLRIRAGIINSVVPRVVVKINRWPAPIEIPRNSRLGYGVKRGSLHAGFQIFTKRRHEPNAGLIYIFRLLPGSVVAALKYVFAQRPSLFAREPEMRGDKK